ncbi:MAG: methylated-DNA--[protein]-cysteine S-methyltransferase [Planctomycetota bacterium]
MSIYVDRFSSPVGDLAVAVDEDGELLRLEFLGSSPFQIFAENVRDRTGASPAASCRRCATVRGQLREYFDGERREFDLELRPSGTIFQLRVWEELRRIPYGETRTYGEIAARIDAPHSFRAVGQANHHNPIPIVIPCHRVVGADGSLTGFGGGLAVKRALLALESAAGARLELNTVP